MHTHTQDTSNFTRDEFDEQKNNNKFGISVHPTVWVNGQTCTERSRIVCLVRPDLIVVLVYTTSRNIDKLRRRQRLCCVPIYTEPAAIQWWRRRRCRRRRRRHRSQCPCMCAGASFQYTRKRRLAVPSVARAVVLRYDDIRSHNAPFSSLAAAASGPRDCVAMRCANAFRIFECVRVSCAYKWHTRPVVTHSPTIFINTEIPHFSTMFMQMAIKK